MNTGLHHVEYVMGTAVTIDIADPLPKPGAVEQACAWLHEVDRRFSTHRTDSEVSRLDHGQLRIEDSSADLRAVLDTCASLWRQTGGFFDAYATGRLDPSGYVKGWSVEVASAQMAAAGAVNHCINAGGDVRTRGQPTPQRPWRIGIRHPWQPDKLAWVVAGTDMAVATSGTYERGHHVIDPTTGQPARALRSVTVLGTDLAYADAYATAALAMGRPGLAWLAALDESGYQAAAVTADGEAFRSAGFPAAPLQVRP